MTNDTYFGTFYIGLQHHLSFLYKECSIQLS